MKHSHLQRMASSSHATYLQRSDFHGWVIDFTKAVGPPKKRDFGLYPKSSNESDEEVGKLSSPRKVTGTGPA